MVTRATNLDRFFPKLFLVLAWVLMSCLFSKSAQYEAVAGKLGANVVTNLEHGISLDALIKQTGVKPTHQFTAQIGTNEMLCVSLALERPHGRFYLLFQDGGLASLQCPPKREYELKSYGGKPWQVPKATDPEKRMNGVIKGKNLSPKEITEKLNEWRKVEDDMAKRGESRNMLPAVAVFAPYWRTNEPARRRAAAEVVELAEKFDPFQIRLGMAEDRVQEFFGKPVVQSNIGYNYTQRVYGAPLPRNAPGQSPSVWVTIIFREQKVIRVFAGDFFDKRLLEEGSPSLESEGQR